MILVTAFESFDGLPSNPSEDVARVLEDRDVDVVVLPVDYGRIGTAVADALDAPWDAVLMLGLAMERREISLERIARNRIDVRRPDNAGNASIRRQVIPGGPSAFFSTLPLEAIARGLREIGVPVGFSRDAGDYLCNFAFYLARHSLGEAGGPCGFVHLPPTPELTADGGGLPLTEQIRAVRTMIESLRALVA